jgi:hypothetical protein
MTEDLPTKKKIFIRWTTDMKYKLAFYTSKFEAYIKTDDLMADKWKKVLEALMKDSAFDENFKMNPPEAETLATTFKRNKAEVLKELGISEEGANLSGLEGEPTPYQLLMINMEEEIQKYSNKKKEEKEKEKKKKAAIFTHEQDLLRNQMKNSAPKSNSRSEKQLELCDEDRSSDDYEESTEFVVKKTPNSKGSESVISTVTTKTSESSNTKRKDSSTRTVFGASFINSLVDLTKDDPLLVEEDVKDRALKRKRDQEVHEAELSKFQRQLEMEERRLSLEERRLKLEEAKHEMLMNALMAKK